MFNLRFKYVVATNILYCFFGMIPKAEYMLAHPEKYTEKQKYDLACKIMGHMKKRAHAGTDVYGIDNIPDEKGMIFYSNHQGKYDALGILLSLGRPCGVLWEKKQAKRILSRQVCGLLDGEPIELTDIRESVKSIKNVTDAVTAGKNFLIFPEGGYTDNKNDLQDFKTGCFSISLKTKGTIVPVTIFDSYKAMNSNTFEHVQTQVHYLKPIRAEEYEGMKKAELAELIKGRISERLEAIKRGESFTPDLSI